MNNSITQKPAGSRYSTMSLVQVAIFGAIICIMAFTPFLGYIPLPFTRATIIHIPVIIASLLMGPKKGGVLGFLFGLTSFINNTLNPTATSFVFTPFYSIGEISGGIGSVIICFIPRILVGVLPYFVYKLVLKLSSEETKKAGRVQYRTCSVRSGGSSCKYVAGYEPDLCILRRSIYRSKRKSCGVGIYSDLVYNRY